MNPLLVNGNYAPTTQQQILLQQQQLLLQEIAIKRAQVSSILFPQERESNKAPLRELAKNFETQLRLLIRLKPICSSAKEFLPYHVFSFEPSLQSRNDSVLVSKKSINFFEKWA